MIQALIYKEWIKTHRVVILVCAVFVATIVYALINTGQQFRVGGAVQTWAAVILKNSSVIPGFVKWFPLLAGILLGIAQFTPEMHDKRLKLTLHLPLEETKIMSVLLLYGISILAAIFISTYSILAISLSFYFPAEIIISMICSNLPYLLAGIFGYLFASWICIEPVWRLRIVYSVASLGFLSFLFIDSIPGGYISFMPYLVVIMAIGFLLPFYSMQRFKDGAQ